MFTPLLFVVIGRTELDVEHLSVVVAVELSLHLYEQTV